MRFEEFTVGESYKTEPVYISEEEIMEFANKYDPQYLHLDKNAAEAGPYGKIIASGYHTLLAIWPKIVGLSLFGSDVLGGLGIERLRWKRPVVPDDQLIGELSISGKELLSDGKRGLLTFHVSIKNQNGMEVLVMETNGIFKTNFMG
ncbi:MaoC/PaaZ C-terminal domain-containing protein [Bacillus sp. FJAT-29814]|uniref:MaoC/PaaZ C-terminal domain-containing protein n=1 Tax=Bacillus sp. FJAT-29814 TaxID=1729688 RepID=UPI00082D5060|nr:MaoC/PaaZ C-terminal domain-containing protein [Bacillus sp. FJAT-29814]